jgi:hypothetical protein
VLWGHGASLLGEIDYSRAGRPSGPDCQVSRYETMSRR